MTSVADRYDRHAKDYERYWAPVLDASARRLLDRVESDVARLGRPARILDIGTGSGVLALEALTRWPGSEVIGLDASSGMLAIARESARRAGRSSADGHLRWMRGDADAMPIGESSVDIVVSSFVYQLVPDRAAALREALRVLRPGGRIAVVSWLDRGDAFAPDVEFDEAVYDLEIEEPEEEEEEARAGDFRSARGAATELRRAGFVRVNARPEVLEYSWTLEDYIDFEEHYHERALFTSLDADTSRSLRNRVRERFAALPDDAFTWRTEIVSVVGQRPT